MHLKLTITSGALSGQSFDLDTGFMTIGRGQTCTVRFDPNNERIASKQHAIIEARPDGFYIVDNNSTNGTIVNGTRVQRELLKHGDTIQFGRNGVTATVQIDAFDSVPTATAQVDFREMQLREFEQAAAQKPESVQTSLANIGLGQIEIKPPEAPKSNALKMLGIGITLFASSSSLIVIGLMFLSVGPIPAVIAAVVAFTPAMFYLRR